MKGKNIFFTLILFSITCLVFAQNNADATKVESLLKKCQDMYKNTNAFSFETDYKSYGSHEDTEVLEHYKGLMLRSQKQLYLGIQNTILLSDENRTIKVFNSEKVIEVLDLKNDDLIKQSPIFMEDILKHYKYKSLEETPTHFICTLQTALITQMPYGKIVIYINKKDYSISKQINYLLARLPYYSNKTGNKKIGNPRIEMNITNFKKTLTNEELESMKFSNYIKIKGSKFIPTNTYSGYTVEML